MDITMFNLKKFSGLNKQSVILPTGEYVATLNSSSQSKPKDDSTMLRLIWKIKEGKYQGDYFFSYFNMTKEDSLKVLFIMISNMGFEPEKVRNISELYGSDCFLKVRLLNHIVHGKSNIVDRYLPLNDSVLQNFPYGLLLST
ncbi:MAG: hypothetical protein HQK79_21160 [Desulfobacterales bacterium]|nr:hypothetical protein [Desulfobacterales bacterium]